MGLHQSLAWAQPQRWQIMVWVLLVAAGLGGNYFAYPIFLNIDFLFGGVFALLALQLFGIWPGTLAAALIASYTYVIWNEPYALIIMSAEVAVVGYLMARRKLNMVLADTLYWLVIGIPLMYGFYHFILKVPDSAVWMIATKQAVNGIAAALLARLVYSGFGVIFRRGQRTFGEVMANLLVLFVVGPSLLLLGLNSREDFAHVDRELRDDLKLHGEHATALFQLWIKERSDILLELATEANSVPAAQFNTRLELIRQADANFLRMALCDKDSVVRAHAPATDAAGHSAIGKLLTPPNLETLRQNGQPILTEVFMSRLDAPARPIALLLHPVFRQGQFDGYVSAVLKFDVIYSMFSHAVQDTDTQTLFTLIDQQGRSIISNRPGQTQMQPLLRSGDGTLTPVGGGVQQWLPEVSADTSISDRWRQSYYVLETPVGLHGEWKLVLEDPVAPVQHLLYTKYARQLGVLFILILLSVVLAEFLSRKSVATLRALGEFTHALTEKINNGVQTVNWPRSAMLETSALICNFKSMATSLQSTFDELKQVNATLEQQVAERTQQLRGSEQRFRDMVFWMPEPMAVHRDGKFIYVNPAAINLLGAESAQELVGTAILERVHPDYRAAVLERVTRAREKGESVPMLHEKFIRLDGVAIDVEVTAVPIEFDGKPAIQVAVHDVTEKNRYQQQLKTLLREQAAVLNNELIGIVRVIDRHIVWANAAFEKMLGYAPGQARGTPTRQNYPSDEAYQRLGDAAYPVLAEGKIYRSQIEHVRRDGSLIWADLSGTILNAASGESLWTFSDITDHMKAESILHAYAFHDPLTQLPNRRMLVDRMTQAMAAGQRNGLYGAVLFLDLDNFKPLNDTHGHDIGDLLLVEVANRLTNCVRKVDTVARVGGDEFVLLIGELNADKHACVTQVQGIAEKIRVSLSQPYFITPRATAPDSTVIEHHCTASVGVALFHGESEPLNDVLQHADQAMYQAKDAGRNQVRVYAALALPGPIR